MNNNAKYIKMILSKLIICTKYIKNSMHGEYSVLVLVV